MTKVGLVQINNSFSGQNYLPLSVGVLQAYVESKRPGEYEWMTPIYQRVGVDEAVAHLEDADVVLFSVYVWNFQLSLAIARKLTCRVVFGGPHVSDNLCDKYSFIDEMCQGEGERWTLKMLTGEYSDETTDYPSPYLSGTFNRLMAARPEENWVALWETTRGCPFSCTFCDWGKEDMRVRKFGMERLKKEIDWFAAHRIEYVYCCDANFGMLERDLELVEYIAEVKRVTGFPHRVSVQNTKNSTERSYAVQKLLSDNGLNQGVTVSMQSLDSGVLKAVRRENISLESFKTIQGRFNRDGVATYTDLIIGLPGETYETFVDGAVSVIESGQRNRIQFNNLSILPNTEMARAEYRAAYGIETVRGRIINGHGALIADEVEEEQELVIATSAMPRRAWVKTRAMSWMIGLLYFDKLLQMPLNYLRAKGMSYRTLFELFMKKWEGLRVLGEIRKFFVEKAVEVQDGGEEL